MYNFLAVGSGRVKVLQGEYDLGPGDTLTVESHEAQYIMNSYPWLSLTTWDAEEADVPHSPAAQIQDAQALAAEIAPTPTIKIGAEAHAGDLDEADADLAAQGEVLDDLPVTAKAPEALAYMAFLMEIDPMPLVKIKAIAARYPQNKKVQAVLAEAELKVNPPLPV